MRRKIVAYNRVSDSVLNKLSGMFDVDFFSNINPKTDPAFLKSLKKAEGIIGLELQVDKELLDLAPMLKIVSNVSTGYNNLDIHEMTKRNIMATNTPGVVEETTADAIFGIMLAAARRIPELDQYVKSGGWGQLLTDDKFGCNVHGKTLGIIGMGKIGSKIAKRAHLGFDMNILYHNRSQNKEVEEQFDAKYCDIRTLLRESDFVCIMTPLTPETENLIGEDEFKMMKDSCVFVNGSRGKTVNEEALIKALKNKEIRAAAVDVYHVEPVHPDNPLLKFPNVVTTPHIGSSTHETELEMSELAAKNLVTGLDGKIPPNLINKEAFVSNSINS